MRLIPAALQEHLDSTTTTTCVLLRIELFDGQVFGLTSLDREIAYDDGDGSVTYYAVTGFDASVFAADASFSVDNAESYALTGEPVVLSDDIPTITVEMVEAGALDDASWKAYLVNYLDLTDGHSLLDAGDLGEVRTRDGMVWISELLSYAMRLRQPVGHVWSRLCRATFGASADERYGCGVDAEALWVAGTVTAEAAESDRAFFGDVTTTSPIDPFPGRLRWLTGPNVGRLYSIESFDAGAVALNEPTSYPIETGHTYEIRPDCAKRYTEDCIGTWSNGINFRGEPLIPVGDASAIQVPGGQV